MVPIEMGHPELFCWDRKADTENLRFAQNDVRLGLADDDVGVHQGSGDAASDAH